MSRNPAAIPAQDVPDRTAPSLYPEPFASRVNGRIKKNLSAVFGLTNITVNLTRMLPGAVSALRHAHKTNDEFVYVLRGNPTLVTDAGTTRLAPGMCAGLKDPAGSCGESFHPYGNKTYL
jgi:uncharacterized cupin superfamily protein